MAIQIQLRQGTTTEHNSFTGAVGEVTVDTTKDVPVVHDGVTVGGFPVATRANADGTISLIKKDGTSAGTINANGLFNNTLTSTNTNQALTAAQGKVLKDTLDTAVSSSFGVGQTYSDVTDSRVSGTTYTNSTGKPIVVSVTADGGTNCYVKILTGTLVLAHNRNTYSSGAPSVCATSVIPHGTSYKVEYSGNYIIWAELR